MAGLHVPLPTLRDQPYDWPRMARGRDGSLLLSRTTLSFATPRRLIPALPGSPDPHYDTGLRNCPPSDWPVSTLTDVSPVRQVIRKSQQIEAARCSAESDPVHGQVL